MPSPDATNTMDREIEGCGCLYGDMPFMRNTARKDNDDASDERAASHNYRHGPITVSEGGHVESPGQRQENMNPR